MPRLLLHFILLLFTVLSVRGQKAFYDDYPYPRDAFINPLGIDWKLSGTFGEPRGNHFHAGTDVKTNGSEGYKLYAVADGFVARIKVSPYGYGKALYIAHPNGFTSVYAHMSGFNPTIDSLVKKRQYADREFEQDIYLPAGSITLKQGELIGMSGNSGGSAGPHLHFEIRHSASQQILNPLFFGYRVADSRPPSVLGIMITSVQDSYYDAVAEGGSKYYAAAQIADTIEVLEGAIGVGVHSYDFQDIGTNKNGIFRMEVFVDGEAQLQWSMDKMDFAEGRYVNAFRDFQENKKGRTIYNGFRLPGNALSLYEYLSNDGYIDLDRGQRREVEIRVWDFHGNHTEVAFVLKGIKRDDLDVQADSAFLENTIAVTWNEALSFQRDGFRAWFPEGTFYDNVTLSYSRRESSGSSIHSDIFKVHDAFVPMQKNAVIQIDGSGIPEGLKPKAVLVHKDLKGAEQALHSFWKDGLLSGKCREVGSFYAKLDTVPPLVQWINYNAKLNTFRGEQIRVRISDDLSGIKDYNGYINGQWVVFDYDAKRRLLTYDFDEHCPAGENLLKMVVEDDLGNTTIKETKFTAD